jgi:type I restriction enzyme S subunit
VSDRTSWPRLALKQLVGARAITYGVVQPGREVAAGIPILRVKNFDGSGLNLTEVLRISPEVEHKYGRSRLEGGEVLITLVGTVGLTAVAPPETAGWNVARAVGVIPVQDLNAARWVRWCLAAPASTRHLQARLNTTVQKTLNLRDLGELEVPMPPQSEMEAIIDVLGSLEDKIESNRRLAVLLAESSSTLFETATRDASWQVPLGDWVEVIDCLHSRKPKRLPEGRVLLQLNNIREDGLIDTSDAYLIAEDDYVEWTRRMELDQGDCVITNVGRVGAAARMPDAGAALGRNMTGLRVRSSWPFPAVLIEALLSRRTRRGIESLTDAGTVMNALNVRNIPKLPLPRLPEAAFRALEAELLPVWRLREGLLRESRTLADLRDTLLPKLVSGQIRVGDSLDLVDAS